MTQKQTQEENSKPVFLAKDVTAQHLAKYLYEHEDVTQKEAKLLSQFVVARDDSSLPTVPTIENTQWMIQILNRIQKTNFDPFREIFSIFRDAPVQEPTLPSQKSESLASGS